MTKTVATSAKRVIFDARPANSCLTGIGRYARTMSALMKSAPGLECFSIGEDLDWSPRSPVEEELELPALLEANAADVFHSPLFHLPSVVPCKSVVTLHDAIPVVRPEFSNPGFTKLFEERARDAALRANAVVCPSEHAKRDIVAALGVAPEKVHVVVETPAPHFRALRQAESAGHHLLVVGSLEARKNPGVVLDALAILPSAERPRVAFVGPEAGFDLLEEAESRNVLESVESRGVVSDSELVRLYNDAIALVCPSRYEGFGLPVVEAFACGTPVIASNAASLPEVAGQGGIFFDPENPSALAEAVRSLTEERRSDLRVRGFQRLESFSRRRVLDQLAQLYSGLERTH